MSNADAIQKNKDSGDDFRTPYMCVQALIDNHKIKKTSKILDPCCGDGVIGKALKVNGFSNVTERDIKTGYDFHTETEKYDYIIMNSPYSDKTNFHFKAFTIAENVISILPQNVTNYNEFQDLFMDMCYFRGKYIMRPKFFMTENTPDKPKTGGVSAYTWFVWRSFPKKFDAVSFERYIDLKQYFREGFYDNDKL